LPENVKFICTSFRNR